jgi:hypothetical protein
MEECLKCEPGTFNNEYNSISCIKPLLWICCVSI